MNLNASRFVARLVRVNLALACLAGASLLVTGLTTVPAGAGAQRLDIVTATPTQLGIRYGQAAGIALVCYGLRVSPDVEKLKERFTGADRETFDTQANKILAMWERTRKCEDSQGPNECKLSHAWSCRDGFNELGPQGTVLPGLVEQRVK